MYYLHFPEGASCQGGTRAAVSEAFFPLSKNPKQLSLLWILSCTMFPIGIFYLMYVRWLSRKSVSVVTVIWQSHILLSLWMQWKHLSRLSSGTGRHQFSSLFLVPCDRFPLQTKRSRGFVFSWYERGKKRARKGKRRRLNDSLHLSPLPEKVCHSVHTTRTEVIWITFQLFKLNE